MAVENLENIYSQATGVDSVSNFHIDLVMRLAFLSLRYQETLDSFLILVLCGCLLVKHIIFMCVSGVGNSDISLQCSSL